MSNLQEKLETLRQRQAEVIKEIRALSGTLFSEESKTLFEKFPTLRSFSWTQCTPYFNDGDLCTFGANVEYPYLLFDGDEEEDLYNSWGLIEQEDGTFIRRNSTYEVNDRDIVGYFVVRFLKQFDEDTLESMFGDHVKITVHRDGRVVQDEYEHE